MVQTYYWIKYKRLQDGMICKYITQRGSADAYFNKNRLAGMLRNLFWKAKIGRIIIKKRSTAFKSVLHGTRAYTF